MHPACRSICAKCVFAAVLMLWGTALMATGQSRTAQVLVLKDPTPREPDLDKRFKTATPPALTDTARLAAYNQQRLKLLGQASAHVSALAAALESSLAGHREGTPFTREVQFARAMEELAGNMYSSLAATTARPANRSAAAASSAAGIVPGTNPEKDAELLAASRELTVQAHELQAEVSKSTADTLPVGVVVKTARVREEARALKDRLQEH